MAGSARSSGPGPASVPGGASDTSLLGSATTWPLQRYARFLPPTDGDGEGQNSSSWKVFESKEESGHLILTIVVSGHFFISQGRTVLEGFSLIDSHKWLKIVRRADCLLLRNECRMFRVQFGGDSKAQMLDHCCSCVQKLAEYLPVEVTDEQSQKLYPSLLQPANGENQVGQGTAGEGTAELLLVSRHPAWPAQELGPFIRLCLMDQDFPAFVEDVEKELKKLTEG
uniref:REC114 meiotic recombination protein n=1 Tax=Calidris pygmaea TaxID=425635 RepID=A0A8C3KRV6_9CHAR